MNDLTQDFFPVPRFPNYVVNRFGLVKRLPLSKEQRNRGNRNADAELVIAHCMSADGYVIVNLNHNKKVSYVRLHRIIAEVFIPNPNNYPEVNHINGIRSDFQIHNLEWVTRKGNMEHAVRTGLFPLGMRHKWAKLTDEQVRQIRKDVNDGMMRKLVAQKYGINRNYVYELVNGKARRFLTD